MEVANWKFQGLQIFSLRRNPPSLRGWVHMRKTLLPTFWKPSRGAGGLISPPRGFYLISLFGTHLPWASTLLTRASIWDFCILTFRQTGSLIFRGNRCLRARVPTLPFHLKVSFPRSAIIKNRGIHQKKPLNIAMKSLWKQKQANKGMLTGSQKPHSVAINITPKLLEVTCLFIEGLSQHLFIAWLLKPAA